ncbi:EAL domain-containing protein [Almyronema epifaneia]|uniref:EAL domain-containing protein n=1 Tax=Almyronema epifaneia S1 TaxID=2991925 RepID=A0ABW6IJZ1_9CYAN
MTGSLARQQIEQDISSELTHFAHQMARELDLNMFERYREIQIIAGLDPFRRSQATADQQQLLNTLQDSYPNYSWIGFANSKGTVQASTQGLLQGQSVVERDWFTQAQSNPYVGDVHEALLLEKLLPNPGNTSLRFVDVAAPVYDSQGSFQGVLGAHLSWEWASNVKAALLNTPIGVNKEIFVIDQSGVVLLGPEIWQGEKLELESLRLARTQQKGHLVERWPDGNTYLVGFVKSQGYRSYPGLGWTILVHESTTTAFSPARSLYWQIFRGGIFLGSGFAVIGWLIAHRITRPLLQIAEVADQIRIGNPVINLPTIAGHSEIARFSQALNQLITNLFEREQELRQIVDGIEDPLLLREVNTGKLIYSNKGFANLYDRSATVYSSPQAWIESVHPDDQSWVAEKIKAEIRGEAFFDDEYRVIDSRSNTCWIWDRSFPIRDENGQIYRYVVIKRDITELKRSSNILQTLMQGTAAVTGQAFFQKLVEHLAAALNADHVFVAEQVGTELRSLAFWSQGQLQPPIQYSPANTPCERILAEGLYHCCDQVAQAFPENPYLLQLRANGYIGVSLVNAAGDVLGTLCVVCQKPLSNRDDYVSILQIFAHRAAAELERQRSKTALQESEARFRLLAENVKDLVCLHDLSGTFLYLSPSCKSLLGFEPEDLVGSNLDQYCHPDDLTLMRLELQQVVQREYAEPITYRIRHRDGRYIWLESLIKIVLSSDGRKTYLQTSSRDITEKVRIQQQLEYDANYDRLTTLPNRNLLLERLDLALERSRRHTNFQFAILFIDLDRFKVINDSLGHQAGDRLLQMTAQKLKKMIRGLDLAARIGSDEFVLLLEEISGLQAAIRIAERILDDLQETISLGEHEVVISASIGIALGKPDYAKSLDLLRDADIAMHSAKQKGKSCYTLFNQKMYKQAIWRLELENALRQALERQEFTLCYQPIVILTTGELAGFEVLVRWQHPEKGTISPADFIPVAEDTGLIVPIGTWILQAACYQMATWQIRFPAAKALKISVNLSVKQLTDSSLITQIKQILQETGLASQSLTLEITESMFMEDISAINRQLKRLTALGIQISIDDFGTGFSSLSYLHRLSVNNLKIDRSFVSNLFESHRNLNVTETIIKLAEQLGLEAIAEGIETQEQLHQLQAFGCNLGQGYLFNAPLSAEVAESLIA